MTSDPWYRDGLQFKCTECGKCCSGFPGFVWLEAIDVKNLATLLNISEQEFITRYTRTVDRKISLIEKENFDCIFFKEKKCSVYQARPKQCRTYPFWKENLKSKKVWDEEKKYCEGINHEEGAFFSLSEIREKL